MNIQQFQYILAVVDLKNFELAAERCFVTQSTLSTMISRFEDEIGVKVFNRKTKPVSINPEGQIIIDRLRIISHEIDSLKNALQELKGQMVGELSIGVIPTIAPYLLPLFLTEFANDFPQVKISVKEMTTSEIQKSLRNRTLDLGILAIPLEDSELEETPLFAEPFLVYDCRKSKKDKKISIDKLDYSKLWLLKEGHCLRAQVNQICELSNNTTKSKINFEFESGSMGSLVRFTKASNGMTIIPFLASMEFSDVDRENLVQFEKPIPVRSVGIITHKFFVKKQLANKLKEIIQKNVKELIPLNEELAVFKPY